MSSGIYKYENNINHKIYIGQSIDLQRRYDKHKKNIYDKSHNEVFYKALRKYGLKNFTYTILESFEEYIPEQLNQLEIEYIKKYNCKVPNGYNMNDGGSNGTGLSKGKMVEQYDLNGNYIATYNSCHIASNITGINYSSISACARGNITHTKEYQWKYTNSDKVITPLLHITMVKRAVCQYDLNYNLINTFSSIKEAAETTNIDNSLISMCCAGKIQTTNNYIFRFQDNFFYNEKKVIDHRHDRRRIVLQFSLDGEFIKQWDGGIEQVVSELRLNRGNLCSACCGKRHTVGGYIWKYKQQ